MAWIHGGEGYWQTESSRKILYWTIAAVAVPSVGFVVWWITEKSFNRFAPFQYHYRPGTITSFLSRILDRHAQRRRDRAPIRIYMDGCFDMMHYGHANALRQAGALGNQLVLGLIPDSEILRCKGPPVMNEAERKTMVESVKWVGEVITGVPYDLTPEFLEELFTKHNIDYVVHGDDPCLLPDGTDAYAHAKKQGRFRMIKRTEGVSSTDIVGRMLMCTRANPRFQAEKRELAKQFSDRTNFESVPVIPEDHEVETIPEGKGLEGKGGLEPGSNHTTLSRFMPTSRRIVQFSDGIPAPPGARIVYIDGAFDMFHPGHIDILKLARQQGDFLLVGLHTDEDIGERRGKHLPIMDVHERSLSVLACRYINEVIIGAPLMVTEDLIKTFNISLVVRGTVSECQHRDEKESRRYAYPKSRNIFRSLQSPSSMTTATIIQRIVQNRSAYEARNAKKNKSEAEYYTSKEYVNEK